jgi:hypothetical protein
MGKTYKHQCKTGSFKNYLTRIPGSLSSKKCANNNNGNLQEEDPQQEQVTLVKEWNGIRPTVKGKLLRELYTDLVDKYVKTRKERNIVNNHSMNINSLLKELTNGYNGHNPELRILLILHIRI